MSERRPEPDPRLTLGAGAALLAIGLWLLFGRPGPSGLGLTIAGLLFTSWALWRLVSDRR
jgi:hypothetical protein